LPWGRDPINHPSLKGGAMTRDELITWALANGWKQDRFGHLEKEEHEGLRRGALWARLKLGKLAVRYEVHSHAGWVRVRSAYYKDLSITADGKLAGMKF
jgi:hypothetical protein